MAKVYLETSFISACVSTRTDVASAYRQEASLAWWNSRAGRHQVFISDAVLTELSDKRYPRSQAALEFIEGVGLISLTPKVVALAKVLVERLVMPKPIAGDAMHVAAAVVEGMHYVLTWNVQHLANPNKVQHLNAVCLDFGLIAPRILRPDDLMEIGYESD